MRVSWAKLYKNSTNAHGFALNMYNTVSTNRLLISTPQPRTIIFFFPPPFLPSFLFHLVVHFCSVLFGSVLLGFVYICRDGLYLEMPPVSLHWCRCTRNPEVHEPLEEGVKGPGMQFET